MDSLEKEEEAPSEIKKKISWLLGKMFETRFPHASGREEG
jgi:hypothetical protein